MENGLNLSENSLEVVYCSLFKTAEIGSLKEVPHSRRETGQGENSTGEVAEGARL